jgi:hypothetical protein
VEKNPHESLKHINEILRQFASGDEGDVPRKRPVREKSNRVEGKVIRFYLDVTGRRLKDLEGRVVKVTGVNGQAGIENPRFPEGKNLEVLKARLAAIIASDCHLRDSGRVTYNEEHLERIARVQAILQNFGDIRLRPVFRHGSYEAHIQNQIGLMMILEGMTPGAKAINNPGLPRGFLEWSEEARMAYLEELIPEDGSFSAKKGFAWFRSHLLYSGDINDSSSFKSVISSDEVELVKRKGNPSRGLVPQSELAYGILWKLQKSKDNIEAQLAANIVRAVDENRNNLIDDETEIARSLGIGVTLSPTSVKYFPKTGNVSVKWTASTTTKEDARLWAEDFPPNDERKRREVDSWLKEIAKN